MLTYPCRDVLKHLKKLTRNTDCNISYLYGTTSFSLDDTDEVYDYQKYQDEIESIISHLVESGYLQYNYGNNVNFHLTQKGLHHSSLTFQSAIIFLFKNFALPIVVSIITTLITLYIKGQL